MQRVVENHMGGVCFPNFMFMKSGAQILSGLLEEHGADSVHVFTHISSLWAAPETTSSQSIISILPQSLSSSSSSSLNLFFRLYPGFSSLFSLIWSHVPLSSESVCLLILLCAHSKG